MFLAVIATAMAMPAALAQVNRCDVNYDNEVNTADVTAIYNRIITGEEPQKPVMQRETFVANGVAFVMMPVEGGIFMMGATAEQETPILQDKSVHLVTLGDYHIGRTEVTQELWEAVTGSNPSNSKGDFLPVEKVSWEDCQTFISKLNTLLADQLNGREFRLPTEAEWEFAARGGLRSMHHKFSGSDTLDDVAWYNDNSGGKSYTVARKAPNELGLYDMSGNVLEWCHDWYDSYTVEDQTNPTGSVWGSYRVFRGGSWSRNAEYCRTACRFKNTPSSTFDDLGLRLALH